MRTGELLVGAGVGAALAFMLDADRGSRRDRVSHEGVAGDPLVDRVRARIGDAVSHPLAIDVEAQGADVTLRGPILSSEVDDLLVAAAAVRGVRSVTNEVEPHDSSEGVPSLQSRREMAPAWSLRNRHWSPAARAFVTAGVATGLCLAAYARR